MMKHGAREPISGGTKMKAVKIRADGSVKLPSNILRLFPPASSLAVSVKGNTIVLKRMGVGRSSRSKTMIGGQAISMEDVAEEIHEIRRERRGQRT